MSALYFIIRAWRPAIISCCILRQGERSSNLNINEMGRVEIALGGRHGGVVGLGAVMMATANGVDTHPVERGVWLLENVLGMAPPPPPDNVPALAPDTSGATTLRDQLEAHSSDPACNACHQTIDPLGMVLENFDPVGRWRDHYPRYVRPADGEESLDEEFYSTVGKGVLEGPPVDAAAPAPTIDTVPRVPSSPAPSPGKSGWPR